MRERKKGDEPSHVCLWEGNFVIKVGQDRGIQDQWRSLKAGGWVGLSMRIESPFGRDGGIS